MPAHYDYQDKTKAERRERAAAKAKERMDQGKRVKELVRLIKARAVAAQKEIEEKSSQVSKGGKS